MLALPHHPCLSATWWGDLPDHLDDQPHASRRRRQADVRFAWNCSSDACLFRTDAESVSRFHPLDPQGSNPANADLQEQVSPEGAKDGL